MTDNELLQQISDQLAEIQTLLEGTWTTLSFLHSNALWLIGFAMGWRLWSVVLSWCSLSINWPNGR